MAAMSCSGLGGHVGVGDGMAKSTGSPAWALLVLLVPVVWCLISEVVPWCLGMSLGMLVAGLWSQSCYGAGGSCLKDPVFVLVASGPHQVMASSIRVTTTLLGCGVE